MIYSVYTNTDIIHGGSFFMPLISLSFATFFVVFTLLYHLAPRFKSSLTMQRVLLLVGSIAFYAFSDIRFVPFLLYIVVLSYLAGLYSKNRLSFTLFLLADLLPLLLFKYTPQDWHANLIFPLGLSFITFQSISYIVDTYTKKIPIETNLLTAALFVSFFPTISSGPIQRAEKLLPQLKAAHHFDYNNATAGIKLFAWGMFKKLCIADKIAVYVNYVYGSAASAEQYGLALLLATVLYSFQIYCDFSGYSDMAIGISRYLGFDVGRNFDHPYLSKSVSEFWRRWHISLSSWLRDYVYIPLGGSRVALPRIYLNLIITFLVSGIWHGSGWNFIIWGLLHGLYQCAGRAMKPIAQRANIPAWLQVFVTFCLVTFTWIFFRAENAQTAFAVIKQIARIPLDAPAILSLHNFLGAKEAIRSIFALDDNAFGGFIGMAELFIVMLPFILGSLVTQKTDGLKKLLPFPLVGRWLLYYAFVILLLLFFPTSMTSNFIYNQF